MSRGSSSADVEIEEKVEETVQEPPRYKVLMHNDNVTTMDFVVDELCSVFNKQRDEARSIMLSVHKTGIGLCGIYTREIAEAKINRVHMDARMANFPLRCSLEEE